MKRTKTITANDGDTKVEITIKINTTRALLREEVTAMAEGLASSIMAQLPHARYLDVPLSKVRVQ